MDKFNNKYRIPSARLKNWDYGSNGAYFITICTHNRQHFFGKIVQTLRCNVSARGDSNESNDSFETLRCNVSSMQLNEIGQLAEKFWMEIPNHFPFVELGNFVVMPNHTHGILIINKMDGDDFAPVQTLHRNVSNRDSNESFDSSETLQCNVSSGKNEQMAKISPKPGTISTIVRSYKSVVSKYARKINSDFAWQTRFHDHIIRDEQSFERIQTYIENNPMNWNKDKFRANEK